MAFQTESSMACEKVSDSLTEIRLVVISTGVEFEMADKAAADAAVCAVTV